MEIGQEQHLIVRPLPLFTADVATQRRECSPELQQLATLLYVHPAGNTTEELQASAWAASWGNFAFRHSTSAQALEQLPKHLVVTIQCRNLHGSPTPFLAPGHAQPMNEIVSSLAGKVPKEDL